MPVFFDLVPSQGWARQIIGLLGLRFNSRARFCHYGFSSSGSFAVVMNQGLSEMLRSRCVDRGWPRQL